MYFGSPPDGWGVWKCPGKESPTEERPEDKDGGVEHAVAGSGLQTASTKCRPENNYHCMSQTLYLCDLCFSNQGSLHKSIAYVFIRILVLPVVKVQSQTRSCSSSVHCVHVFRQTNTEERKSQIKNLKNYQIPCVQPP